jgi:hypothetical protein
MRNWSSTIPNLAGVNGLNDANQVCNFRTFEMMIGSDWWHLNISADGRTIAVMSTGGSARPMYALYLQESV